MPTRSTMSLLAVLEARGIRLTRQRRVLLRLLDRAEGHVNARDLLRLAQQEDAAINRATVYRTLALLKGEGLIDELDLLHLEGEEHFYERRRAQDHVHVGCPGCGRIVEIETALIPALQLEVLRRTGFQVSSMRIEVRGICPTCHPPVGPSPAGGPGV